MSESMKVEWTDALKTGNKAIDNQHKYLIDIINDVADIIETNGTTQSLRKVINLLQYYTEWHFCNEESCMEKLKCPVLEKNKEAHSQFIETFLGFRAEIEEGGDAHAIATRMYKTLTSWLVQHIQGIDSELAHVSGENSDITS
ncbi:MAG: hemerythrin family protein [Verrucomicrobia bacterium]|nr:hemerythrin family protein [Verrucomicrobiota bacterium]